MLMQLLLVEDHMGDARLLQQLLYAAWQKPVAYTHATTLEAALDRLAETTYQVILTDLGLPDSHGLATFYAIRDAAPTTPILVLSGYTDEATAVEAVRGGAQDYLMKDGLTSPLLIRSIRYAMERKNTESELIRAREEAEKMNRLKSAFLTNLSHEIRTPLTSIMGYASLLSHELDEPYREWAQTIAQGGDRLLRTINSILDLALLESGDFALNREVIDLNTVVQEQVALVMPWIKEKGLNLTAHYQAMPCEVFADRICVDRIVANVLENAVKFTTEGAIVLATRLVNGQASLEITDTGVGIAPSFVQEAFNPFVQESSGEARNYEGIGLGLTITKRLLTLHGGSIAVDSSKGKGSRFTLLFPLHTSKPATTPRSKTIRSQAPKLLVVDDNNETLMLLETILQNKYDVQVASSAKMALQKAEHHMFDLLLLDIKLDGDTSGLTLLNKIRQLPQHRTTRSLAITVFTRPHDREKYLQGGFDYFLPKPFSSAQLYQAIDRTLHQAIRSTG